MKLKWSLFCVKQSFSDNSMTNFVSTLSRMFPGVHDVKHFALGKKKHQVLCELWDIPIFQKTFESSSK